jgi:hypothetical protein
VKGVDVQNNLDVSLTKITSLPIFKIKSKIHFMNNRQPLRKFPIGIPIGKIPIGIFSTGIPIRI